MIDFEYGKPVLTCDCCGFTPDEPFSDFQDALDFANSEGWLKSNHGGVWQNTCPDCK